jgi:hypothetical protein
MKTLVLAIFPLLLLISSKAYSSGGLQPKTARPADTVINGQPLRLQSFSARVLSGNRIELNWLTAETWTTVTHYEIERSFNNAHYSVAGTIAQTNNRPIDHFYVFNDQISNGNGMNTVYYRLRQVSRDGRVSYSHILPVKLTETTELTIWPSPAKEEISISFLNEAGGDVTIRIFDMQGRKAIEKQYVSARGSNIINIEEISRLYAGVYIVQIWAGETLAGKGRFLKIN